MSSNVMQATEKWYSSVHGVAAIFNSLLILNYLIWLAGFGPAASGALFLLVLVVLLVLVPVTFLRNPYIWPVLVFLLVFVLLALGSGTKGWDPRSIWMFHGKRIFIDGSIYSQFDNYADWSHNSYPVIVPALSASMAAVIGHWNEVFPKTAGWFFAVSPLLVAVSIFRSSFFSAAFLVGFFAISGTSFVMGGMDALVGLYLLAALLSLPRLSQFGVLGSGGLYLASTFFNILEMEKNEGYLLVCICLFSYLLASMIFFRSICWRHVAGIFLPAIFLGGLWALQARLSGVKGYYEGGGLFEKFVERATDIDAISRIFNSFGGADFFVYAMIGMVVYMAPKLHEMRRIIFVPMVVFLLYYAALFFSYLSTPAELAWHLRTSVVRVSMSLEIVALQLFLLFLAVLVGLKKAGGIDFEAGRG